MQAAERSSELPQGQPGSGGSSVPRRIAGALPAPHGAPPVPAERAVGRAPRGLHSCRGGSRWRGGDRRAGRGEKQRLLPPQERAAPRAVALAAPAHARAEEGAEPPLLAGPGPAALGAATAVRGCSSLDLELEGFRNASPGRQ